MIRSNTKRFFYRFLFYFIITTLLLIIFYGWWQGSIQTLSSSADRLIAIGRILGLISAFSILLEIIVISRLPLIEKYFDLDEILDLHKLNGYLMVFATLGHIVFLVFAYSNVYKLGLWSQFIQFNTDYKNVLIATLGTILFFTVVMFSIKFARRRIKYQYWYALHLLIYFAILLTFFHQVDNGGDFIAYSWFKTFWYALFVAVIGLLIVYRFIRPLWLSYKHQFKIEKIRQEAKDTYSIYIKGKNIDKYRFLAGQYGTFWFVTNKTFYEGHPYSFSSPPGSRLLRITVKTTGDFGKKVVRLPADTRIIIDGPRGSFTSNRSENDHVVLIAGGIGVAPYLSSIPELLTNKKSVRLMYAVHDTDCLAFNDELSFYKKKGLEVTTYISKKGKRICPNALNECQKSKPDVFICGPSNMTKEFCKVLCSCGLSNKNLIYEKFSI